MTLTLAIPTHNDTASLCRLLQRVAELQLGDHVIVVDDGSDAPVDKAQLCDLSGLPQERLRLLRNDSPRGPGAARNRAILHAVTDHLLFLDADDLPTRELPALIRDLEGREFDFCIFQHHDTRMEQELAWGQMPHDQALWRAAGVDLGALNQVSREAAAQLAGTANYPWNKIYRTGFLRAHAIRCSEILLHEDIELHWRCFLNARTILASDRTGVIHVVNPGGGRLTNRTGPERLALFEPLAQIAEDIMAEAPDTFALPFFRFTLGLFDWIAGNLDPAYHDALAEKTRAFIDGHIPPALLDHIRTLEPARTDLVLTRAGLA